MQARNKAKILAVDDSRSIRDLLRLHLSNAGYHVRTAEDAVVAGRMLLEDKPDLIITDVTLPYLDGVEFVSALQGDDTVPDIPVIFLTSREELPAQIKALRVAAILRKPLDAGRLAQVVALHV